jgi:uncharacterized membrane protein
MLAMTSTFLRAFRAPLLLTLPAALFFATGEAQACPDCATARSVWSQVLENRPGSTLAILTFAFCVVAGLIVLSARLVYRCRLLFGGALLLGAGLGAFLDGIALHQVLQWHAMLSSVLVPVDLVSSKVNMFWDGVFHLYAWLATAFAIVIVVREVPKAAPEVRPRAVSGGALAGWGFFNLVEGVIDHHIFRLHHVHPGIDELAWDVGFLISGVALIAVGFAIALPVLRGVVASKLTARSHA